MADRSGARMWLRWSLRDLRHHWIAGVTIAAVIAIGTGVYAGAGSTAPWRRASNDASFAALNMHDVRVSLSAGTYGPSGALLDAAKSIPHASSIVSANERLIVESSIDASIGPGSDRPGRQRTVLASAIVVGAEFGRGAPVDDLWVARGDASGAVLEVKFADYHGLDDAGTVLLAGGARVAYTGVGLAPEELFVLGPEGSVLAQADLATVYLDLADAQALAGRVGEVNDLVMTVAHDADVDVVVAELDAAIGDRFSAVVSTRDDADAYRILYQDIEGDQQVWNALSALVLAAAALASFNLLSRIVESQRREIGIGMALGAPRWRLAIRPVLLGVQVGVLGTVAGIGVGALLGRAMQGLLRDLLPMPVWVMPFQTGVFLRGAVLGLAPPIAATVLPVWRAVRVEPIEAIRSGHLARAGGRLGGWARRVRVPGGSQMQMPLRNLARAPRRTVLTALGVGAAITALVAVLGMLDSFSGTIDGGAAEVTKGDPDRVTVVLEGLQPAAGGVVGTIAVLPEVSLAEPSLRLPATVHAGASSLTVAIELIDLEVASWTPTITGEASSGAGSGLILSSKARRDLGVGLGDTVTLSHPQRTATGFATVDDTFLVSATHANPFRAVAFLDASYAGGFGLDGVANLVQVTPAPGVDRGDVVRAVFALDGVASAQPVARLGEVFDEMLAQYSGIIAITAGAVLVLALLIAMNSARISVDERRREHATMLAFGMRTRSVVGELVAEAVVVGVLATLLGAAAGVLALRWLIGSIAARTLPELDVAITVSSATMITALVIGVAGVALAPVLLWRRIATTPLPETLRVME